MSPIIQAIRDQIAPRKKRLPRGALARIAEHCGVHSPTVLRWMKGSVPRESAMASLQSLAGMLAAKKTEFCVDLTGKWERNAKKN